LESDSFLRLILFFVLIVLSAFFSGSEAAYFSLSREMVGRLKENTSKGARRIVTLLENSRKLLVTILVGNTVVNVSAASVAALLTSDLSEALHFSKDLAIFIEIVVVTLVLLIFSELTPKIVAVKNPLKFANKVSIPLIIIHYLFYPIVTILDQFPALFSGLLATRVKKHLLSKDELKTLIEFSQERGTLEADEREMIHSIFEFSKTIVKQIMVPRIDMVCVERSTSLNKLIDLIHSKGHTRIPLYEEKVDNILGIIHAKELLPFINNKDRQIDLATLARPAMFVPESKRIDELLNELQSEKQHMAIVVDEYGGTAGLITLEDVIEEIVGEIQDEYDKEKPLYKRIEENKFLIDAKIDLDELNEDLGLDLPIDKSYESLGGFIFELTGSVPEKKQEIKYGQYKFIIEKIEKNRIVEVLLIRDNRTEGEKPEEEE